MKSSNAINLVSLKGNPRLIFPTLEATLRFGDNAPKFKDHVMHFAEYSLDSKAETEHIISAQAVPMCRKLDLIEGKLGNLQINDYGRKLLNAFSKGGMDEFLSSLRIVLVKLDYRKPNWKTLLTMLQVASEKNMVSTSALIEALRERGINASIGDRLDRLLRVFQFAKILRYKGEIITSRIYLNDYQEILGRSLFKGSITLKEFVELLHSIYLELAGHYGERIEIWRVRNKVCILKDITGQEFDVLLKSLPPDVYGKDKYLGFSSVLLGGIGGIWKGEKYYYYLAIHKRK